MSCQQNLMALGKPYPRTCQDCGLWGPCKNSTPAQAHDVLKLADWLDGHANGPLAAQRKAAAELRRLHAVNVELLEACKTIVKAFDALPPSDPARHAVLHINAARAVIAKPIGDTL